MVRWRVVFRVRLERMDKKRLLLLLLSHSRYEVRLRIIIIIIVTYRRARDYDQLRMPTTI